MKRTIIALVAVAALAFPAMAKQHGMQQNSSFGRMHDRDDQTMSRGRHAGMRGRSARTVDHYRYRDPAGYFLRTGVGYAGAKDYDNPRYYRGRPGERGVRTARNRSAGSRTHGGGMSNSRQ